jgi:competence protein ComEC
MDKIKNNLGAVFLFCLAAAASLIWYAVFYFESHQNLTVTFFDVGQGDAIFIETPNGNQVLIDGGPDDGILSKLGREMPFWDRSIDAVILTHPDKDHVAGLIDVLKRYEVDLILWTGVKHSSAEYRKWADLLDKKNIRAVIARAGQQIKIGDGAFFKILAPFDNLEKESSAKINNTSVVIRLDHGKNSFLFTGDIEKSVERRLLFEAHELMDADILKVAHHGSKTSSLEEFLQAVSPDLSVIQVGRKNRYGHPAEEVLDRLASVGTTILRNDLDGDIVIESDGNIHRLRK